MKSLILAGVALIVAGSFLLFGGGFTSQRDVLKVGELTVSAEEKRSVSPWIAGLVLLSGLVLVFEGVRRRT